MRASAAVAVLAVQGVAGPAAVLAVQAVQAEARGSNQDPGGTEFYTGTATLAGDDSVPNGVTKQD
jgi:hypothetical protein